MEKKIDRIDDMISRIFAFYDEVDSEDDRRCPVYDEVKPAEKYEFFSRLFAAIEEIEKNK